MSNCDPTSSHYHRNSLIPPNPQYMGRNGFNEPPVTLQQKLEVHEVALDTLRLRAVAIPPLQEILSTDWKPARDTVESLKKQIEELREDQRNFLTKLYDLNATAYLEDAEHRYYSRNELLDMDPKEWIENVKQRQAGRDKDAMDVDMDISQHELQLMAEENERQRKLFDESYPYPFSPTAPSPDRLPTINRHNYAYLKRLHDLQKRLRAAEINQAKFEAEEKTRLAQEVYNQQRNEEERRIKEERERRIKENAFPASLAEFKMKPSQVKDRIVRFLCLNSGRELVPGQKQMLSEFHWSKEDVLPLLREYANNDRFRAEVQAEYGVQRMKTQTRDPRRA